MKKISKILCLVLILVLCTASLSGCLHKKDEVALKIGNYQITSGMYACAMINADLEARNNVNTILSAQPGYDSSIEVDYTAQKIDGVPYSDWVKNRAIELCKEQAYIMMKADKLGLEIDTTVLTNAKQSAESNWYDNAEYYRYQPNGVSYDTYYKYYLNTLMITEYFLTLYGKDGIKAVAEEDVLKSLYDNYDLTYAIVYQYPSDATDEEMAADKKLFDDYAAKINAGTLTFEEAEELWNAELEKREEEENESNTSSNTSSATTSSDATSSAVSSSSDSTTTSDTTSSEEPYSKPADDKAVLIGTSETGSYTAYTNFDKIHALEVGGALVIEEADENVILFVRGDIKADKYYEKTYYDSALSILKSEDFQTEFETAAYALTYEENKYATSNFSAKKIDYSAYEEYQSYLNSMQNYGGLYS